MNQQLFFFTLAIYFCLITVAFMLRRAKCFPCVIIGFIPVSDCLWVIIAVTKHHGQKQFIIENSEGRNSNQGGAGGKS